MNWSKPLPRAVLAALLTLLVAAPILGLRLQTPITKIGRASCRERV